MRKDSPGLFKGPSVLAIVFALALTLLFGGVANAATISPLQSLIPTPASCLELSPATQTVLVGQPANVAAEVVCYPPGAGPNSGWSLVVTWGDGTSSRYPICLTAACPPPPFVIRTSHVYQLNALLNTIYHPIFCLEPTISIGPAPQCSSVEIIVVSK